MRRAFPDPGSWLQPQVHYHNATLTIHENRKGNEINMLALKLSLLLTTLSSQIFKNMLLNHRKTSICVTALIVSIAFSVSIQQATFSQKPENHSNKIIYLLKNFRCFQWGDSQLDSKCSVFTKNIICVDKSLHFVHHVWVRKNKTK